jgi:hypothetical protein
MNKAFAWVIGFTKVGKALVPVQRVLSGKKTNLAGLAIAVPALVTIIQRFADQGIAYLATLPGSTEFIELMNGCALIFVRQAITKAANPVKDPNLKDVQA